MPSLPVARAELERLLAAFDGPENLSIVGAEATETRVKATALDRFGIIAFATHGLTGGDIKSLTEGADKKEPL